MGCRDHEDLWEHLFEADATEVTTAEHTARVTAWCQLARLDHPAAELDRDGTTAREAEMSTDAPHSPLNVFRSLYVVPGTQLEDEDLLLDSVLSTRIGDEHYPGGTEPSENWPGVGPGTTGINNALSPRHYDMSGFADVPEVGPVLWVRDADAIVSDTSLLDLGHLGSVGAIPGWPGADVYPAQPMVRQMRTVLDRFAAAGGRYEEVVLEGVGHSPHLEDPRPLRRAARRAAQPRRGAAGRDQGRPGPPGAPARRRAGRARHPRQRHQPGRRGPRVRHLRRGGGQRAKVYGVEEAELGEVLRPSAPCSSGRCCPSTSRQPCSCSWGPDLVQTTGSARARGLRGWAAAFLR
ncbi:hypothetical protein [Georgenia sp. SUBG003]|uniref:hypothetical protein n=1 Tax=Georgenia sp. SUBG003 TaxID=1497974 RepID=UPI003AB16A94